MEKTSMTYHICASHFMGRLFYVETLLDKGVYTVQIIPSNIYRYELIKTPLLVQRCNGISAGMGYLEVLELSMQILLLGQLASVRTVNSQWGRMIQLIY